MKRYLLSDFAPFAAGDACRMEAGRLVLDARQAWRAALRAPLSGFCAGDFIQLNLLARNSLEAFRLCYATVRFFHKGALMSGLRSAKPGWETRAEFAGAYQFHGRGAREYSFRFIAPRGADEAELVLTATGGAVLTVEDMHVDIFPAALARGPLPGGLKLVAHLGMTGLAPRNTMPAFALAARAGYRECVTNTNYTRDGYLVALHNDTIDATSNGHGAIREMTLAEARRFDYGRDISPAYAGAELPLLGDVLALMARCGMRPVLRLGSFTGPIGEQRLADMWALVRRLNLAGRVTAKAFNPTVLETFRRIAGPDACRYGFCCTAFDEDRARWLRALGPDVYFDVQHHSLTDDLIGLAAEHGIPVESWIVNDYDRVYTLHEKGVSGFTTDFFPMDGCLID